MLESVSFEFNVRHPLRLVFKILQLEFGLALGAGASVGPDPHARLATLVTNISVDLNYTFALIKQTTSALAIACVELALRLSGRTADLERVFPPAPASPQQGDGEAEGGGAYARFQTTRAAVSETLLDLLDLYATHRAATCAGPSFGLDDVTAVRLRLNALDGGRRIPRYAAPPPPPNASSSPGHHEAAYAAVLRRAAAAHVARANAAAAGASASPTSPAAGATGSDEGRQPANGVRRNNYLAVGGGGAGDVEAITPPGVHAMDEGFPPPQEQAPVRRFVLQSRDAAAEERVLARYFVTREEEYQREEEVEDGWESFEEEDDDERDVKSH
jgi:hypothetical protein